MENNNYKFVDEFVEVCTYGNALRWHERNGGNLSYRMTLSDVESINHTFVETDNWHDLDVRVEKLAGEYFLVTGTGQYFMNVKKHVEKSIGIVQINSTGDKYRIVRGFSDGGRPTSEFPTHLMSHEVKMLETAGKHRVIYHAHTTNVIALSFVLPLKDAVFSKKLWEMATECPVVFPDGVGVLKWMVPGGKEIAIETSKLMKKYNAVVWAHHGLFCSGVDFEETFGLMHTIEKSAEILVKVLSMTNEPLNTISDSEILSLEEPFNININKELL